MEPTGEDSKGTSLSPFRGWGGLADAGGAGDHRGEVGGRRWCMAEHLYMGQLDPQDKCPALQPSACLASPGK